MFKTIHSAKAITIVEQTPPHRNFQLSHDNSIPENYKRNGMILMRV